MHAKKNADKQKYITHECANLLNRNITYLSALGSDHFSVCISASYPASGFCIYLMTKKCSWCRNMGVSFSSLHGLICGLVKQA